jgi:hypothetical protein
VTAERAVHSPVAAVDRRACATVTFRNKSLLRRKFRAGRTRDGEADRFPNDDRFAMTDSTVIDAATRRLAAALDALEAAAERRREADRGESNLAAQVHALGTDRSRLAAELDAATARSRGLEETKPEIARRIDTAIEGVRAVIDAHER